MLMHDSLQMVFPSTKSSHLPTKVKQAIAYPPKKKRPISKVHSKPLASGVIVAAEIKCRLPISNPNRDKTSDWWLGVKF